MRNLTRTLAAQLLFLWCAAAWSAANAQAFGHELGKIPWDSYALVVLLAVIPGSFNVLSKIEAGAIPLGPRTWLTVMREMMGSALAGIMTFYASEAVKVMVMPIPEVLQCLAIGTAGYMGATVIDRYAQRLANTVSPPAPSGE